MMPGGLRPLIAGLVLLALAGCGRSFFAEREPWRREAEVACLKSGQVREGDAVALLKPIDGPGVCGADFPLRVSALGMPTALGFADESRRPPGTVPGPVSIGPPLTGGRRAVSPPFGTTPGASGDAPLGRPAAVLAPAATLACPMVSALDQWIADAVQPAAMKWLGQPVVEIRQISAYSCRGMNNNANARISEHAFGNALDISAFALADGRVVTIREGWRASPSEQGFLRDVHAGACERFSTVLAPGSNVYHYDHVHVDLMRRASGQAVCNPEPVPGEVIAARARARLAARGLAEGRAMARIGSERDEAGITGSLGSAIARTLGGRVSRREADLPRAVPGSD